MCENSTLKSNSTGKRKSIVGSYTVVPQPPNSGLFITLPFASHLFLTPLYHDFAPNLSSFPTIQNHLIASL